jgi:hypothetical protein
MIDEKTTLLLIFTELPRPPTTGIFVPRHDGHALLANESTFFV